MGEVQRLVFLHLILLHFSAKLGLLLLLLLSLLVVATGRQHVNQ